VAFALAALALAPATAQAVPIAFDMVGSASLNLSSFSNPFTGAFSSAGDGFQKYQRFVSPSIPFGVLDDSLSIFPPDSLGIIGESNTDVFFGIVDTQNPDNAGPVSATWTFDVTGFHDLNLSIGMGAMGNFEASDSFQWTYQIDGGPAVTAFASAVDEAGSQTYTLDGGAMFTLDDPMLAESTVLSNNLQTLSTNLSGTGTSLSLTLTAEMDSGSEALAFQNIVVDGTPSPIVAFDMVGSASLNLTSFSNPFNGAFASAGDGTSASSPPPSHSVFWTTVCPSSRRTPWVSSAKAIRMCSLASSTPRTRTMLVRSPPAGYSISRASRIWSFPSTWLPWVTSRAAISLSGPIRSTVAPH
jgi:hypothetical protein